MSKTKVPALKNIPSTVDRELRDTLVSMKEAQEIRLGRLGDPLDRAVTLRELVDSGMAKQLTERPFNPDGLIDFIPNDETIQDLSIPPAPTGLEASGAFTEIIVDWNPAQYSNHAYTEVWRSRDDEVGTATLITTTSSFIITDPVGYDQTYFYWVRFVSTSDVRGPFNRTNGTKATTVENIAEVMGQLSETLADLPGYNLITTTAAAATVIRSSGSPSTRADNSALQLNDIWYDTDDGQIYTRNAANNAWVAARDATLVSLYGSTSYTGSTITAAMATAQADIVTVTNAQSSTASSVTSLTSTVNGHTSSISTLNTTTASHTGDLNAMFVLQVATESNNSKSVAGMVIGSNASDGSGAQSYVQFQADKFAIWSGSASVAPFIIDSGVVYIDTARIKDGAIENAKIDTLNGGKIIAGTITATEIAAGTITGTQIAANTITATEIAANTITASQIAADTITGTEINVDTLAVKKFADVETKIISHRADAAEVPLQVTGENSAWSGTYPGSVIVSVETSSVVNFGVTIQDVRNGSGYRVIYSAVLGDVRNGTIQYSFDNSNWTSLSPLINADSGTYRSYVYVWDGNISGLSSTQSTVYWRINWNVTGGQVNSTYAALYVTMDNTQQT